MIEGFVNAFREPILRITLRGPLNVEFKIEGVVDTGFNGTLTLMPQTIANLGLPFRRRGRAVLADGSEIVFDIYEAVVLLDGEERRISVDSANTEPLIGMNLLYGKELTIHIVDGGKVLVRSPND